MNTNSVCSGPLLPLAGPTTSPIHPLHPTSSFHPTYCMWHTILLDRQGRHWHIWTVLGPIHNNNFSPSILDIQNVRIEIAGNADGGRGRCVGRLRHFLQLLVTETSGNSYFLAKQGLTILSKTVGSVNIWAFNSSFHKAFKNCTEDIQ